MSSTAPSPSPSSITGQGAAALASGRTISTFLGALGTAFALFGIQFAVFYLLRNKFTRIYRPKTYLVPEKNRTDPPPSGLWRWAIPIFKTSNAELISKCGLDAYFFLRYLRFLLKIFVPALVIILPILAPLNATTTDKPTVLGLDKLGFQNYDPNKTDRLWAHLILAVLFLIYIFFVIYDELRGYIRVRQAYLTSPQHRLRASATTVLVTSIPSKWCTYEAMAGLFDVFPGGIRNIWINRNFDDLNDKVQLRNNLAGKLESAETNLIRNAKKAQMEMAIKEAKASGQKKKSKKEKKADIKLHNDTAMTSAMEPGTSSGDPHQALTVEQQLHGVKELQDEPEEEHIEEKPAFGILGRGLGTIGHGIKNLGGGLRGLGRGLVRRNAPHDPGHTEVVNENHEDTRPATSYSFDGPSDAELNPVDPAEGIRYESDPADHSNSLEAPSHLPKNHAPDNRNSSRALKGDEYDYLASQIRETQSPMPTQVNGTALGSSAHDDEKRAAAVEETDFASKPLPRTQTVKPERLDWAHNGFLQQPSHKRTWRNFWKGQQAIALPSPEPHYLGDEQFPFPEGEGASAKSSIHSRETNTLMSRSKIVGLFKDQGPLKRDAPYPTAYDETYDEDQGMESQPEWTKYLKPKDRDTMRLPLFGQTWLPFMPSWTFIGKKVDTIYYCRKEVARLNTEIEADQENPEKYPLMNSAFIQFNHQVAAHMAVQSVSHHIPNHMAPRHVEVAPGDVYWDNLSILWWERILRQIGVTIIVIGLIVAWVIPIAASAAFFNASNLVQYQAFEWIERIPKWLLSGIQGVLPFAIGQIFLALLPIILRWLASLQGVPTGTEAQLLVQNYYFYFSFIQLFLVVTIASSLTKVVQQIGQNPIETVTILAENIPKASNYFFSYILLQALSGSAANLAQVATLALWFLWRPIVDGTARNKFNRQINLPTVTWGTFLPLYTVLACIGIIFSIIAPLMSIFCILSFGLFWIVFRYQMLYVQTYKFDTGGLLFPRAMNQLFVGIYVMELSMIGLFFLVEDPDGNNTCIPQGAIMIAMLLITILYHVLIHYTFSPLYRYMPITLEDDAVRRDEEFERAQLLRWKYDEEVEEHEHELAHESHEMKTITPSSSASSNPDTLRQKTEPTHTLDESHQSEKSAQPVDIHEHLESQEAQDPDAETQAGAESRDLEMGRPVPRSRLLNGASYITMGAAKGIGNVGSGITNTGRTVRSWADRSKNTTARGHDSSAVAATKGPRSPPASPNFSRTNNRDTVISPTQRRREHKLEERGKAFTAAFGATLGLDKLEAAGGATGGGIAKSSKAVGDVLFGSFVDELEDLTAEERDRLVQRAFQHEALRARRPVIWIPRDDLGVSEDEIERTRAFSERGIWISNEFTALDHKARVLFARAPPDFAEVDLIEL